MSKLDDHLRGELHRAAPTPVTDKVFDRLALRHRRRRVARKIGTAALAVVVLAGTAAGFLALDRAFGGGPAPATGTPTNGSVVGVVRDTMRTSHLVLYPADGSAPVDLTPSHQGTDEDPAVSPDGRSLAFVHSPVSLDAATSTLQILDLTTGETRDLVSGEIRDPAWSPDGSEIVIAGSVDSLHAPMGQPLTGLILVAAEGGSSASQIPLEHEASGTIPWAEHPTWSPDGTTIAFEGGDTPEEGGPGVYIGDVRTGEWHGTKVISTNGDVPAKPTWSPDGTWIAVVGDSTISVDDATHDLILVSSDGSATRSVYGEVPVDRRPVVDSLGWSPDGQALVFSGPDGKISTTAIGGTPSEIGTGSTPTWLPAADWTPQPQPDPSGSAAPEVGIDIGLHFRLCGADKLTGLDLLGDGANGTAWTGYPLGEDGTCTERTIVAVDVTGDGTADGWQGPIVPCRYTGCHPLGASDLDGDGDEELVIGTYFSIVDHLYFSISHEAQGASINPIIVAPPGNPKANIEPGEPLMTSAAGDEGFAGWMRCESYPENPVLVWTWVWGAIDGDTKEWHETRIQLQADGMFHVIGTDDRNLPADVDPGFVRSDRPACGVDFRY